MQRKLGGGNGIIGLYGTVAEKGNTDVFTYLKRHTSLGTGSTLVDIGSGLGRYVHISQRTPAFHTREIGYNV